MRSVLKSPSQRHMLNVFANLFLPFAASYIFTFGGIPRCFLHFTPRKRKRKTLCYVIRFSPNAKRVLPFAAVHLPVVAVLQLQHNAVRSQTPASQQEAIKLEIWPQKPSTSLSSSAMHYCRGWHISWGLHFGPYWIDGGGGGSKAAK